MDFLLEHPELLEALRGSDEKACRAAQAIIYREYMPMMHEFLKHGCIIPSTGARVPPVRNADHRADLIHEVFLRLFRPGALVAYDGKRGFDRYVTIVLRNELIDYHRRYGRELLAGKKPLIDEDVLPAPPEPGAEHGWQEEKALAITTKYAAGLSPEMRRVFDTLFDCDGKISQRKAGKHLGIRRGKVRKLRDRMRRELRDLLEQAGIRDSTVTPDPEDDQDDEDDDG